jgi:hypothetical protein
MSRRFRSFLWQGAASAFLVIGEPAIADAADEVDHLPQWVVRAQQRLALAPAQQCEVRRLVDENTVRMQALPHQPKPAEIEALQREFRAGLARILAPEQLAEWNVLLEELLGAVRLRDAPMLARRH